MDQPTAESTILSLPPEIRNTIYYFILVRDQPIAIFSKPRNKSENGVYPVYFPENRRIAELTASDGEAKPRQENKHSENLNRLQILDAFSASMSRSIRKPAISSTLKTPSLLVTHTQTLGILLDQSTRSEH
jgi:hypothetical protein